MKKLIAVLATAAVLIIGCSYIGVLSDVLLGGPDEVPVPVCIVHYATVAPGVDVGSACDNHWLRYAAPDTFCELLSVDELSVIEIDCPAEGDSLGI